MSRFGLPLIAWGCSCGLVLANDGLDFARDVQPILAQHCFTCHGPDRQEGGFRLDKADESTREADSGDRPIVPGMPDASAVIQRLRTSDPDLRMPPPEHEPLSPGQISKLEDWIASGASYTQHWAYRPLMKPTIPQVQDTGWCTNLIDYFVLAGLEAEQLSPSPEAERYTLIKRLHYDLLGLPPTIEDVDKFVADQSPEAYEQLVDRLLASPRFGERWGRHWLDKARYADSDGYEKDNARPDAWHYRDWVIQSVNQDIGFDRFTIAQVAGDLIPNGTDAQRLATAFNRQTLTNTEGGTDQEQWRVAAVMDRTETLSTVWLGLTVGCARCHHHKYDAVTQDEYYQLYAFFNNGDEANAELITPSGSKAKVRIISERADNPRSTHVLTRGDFLRPLHQVPAKTLNCLPAIERTAEQDAPEDRLRLAQWLVGGRNPLPPRVAVNHIWRHLFGQGLVRTMNDFGVRGEPPTHPALLDWLAREFVEQNWSRKRLIRMIVLSSVYRQSSKHRTNLNSVDPTNRFLHRQNRFRVEAEVMRDIALAAGAVLSSRVGGPSVYPPIPESITDLTYNSGFKWQTSDGEDRYRRGMYTFFKRTAPHPNLTTFDCPSSNVTSVARETSNTPIGALVTLNNVVYVEAARHLAHRVLGAPQCSEDERIEYLWRCCLGRPPSEFEVLRLRQLLQESREWYRKHADDARRLIAQAADAETMVESAAWVATARIVLNLDEFITRE